MSDVWSLGIQHLLARVNSFHQPGLFFCSLFYTFVIIISIGSSKSKCKSFLCNTQHIGWIREDAATQLRQYPNVFVEHSDRYINKIK
jgi:hypothetical protein